MMNKYIVRDYSFLFTVVVMKAARGIKLVSFCSVEKMETIVR